MADAAPSIPEKSLLRLKKLARQMGEDSGPDKVTKIGRLAEQFVPVFNQCNEDLGRREQAVTAVEADLAREKVSIEAAKASLKTQEALAKLSKDVGEINARDDKFMNSLLSANDKAVEEIAKTGTIVTESERKLADKMQASQQACADAISSRAGEMSVGIAHGVAAGVRVSLGFGMRCISRGTDALATCENNLALKLDETALAVSTSEDAVTGAVSSCERKLLADGSQTRETLSSAESKLLADGSQTREQLSSSEGKLLADGTQTRAEVSSLRETLETKLTSLSSGLEGLKGEMTRLASSGQEDLSRTLSSHKQEMMSSVGELQRFVEEMGVNVAGAFDEDIVSLQAHVDSVLDTKSKESVTEVRAALEQAVEKLSGELGRCQTELATFMGEDRLKSVFTESCRDGEVLQLLREVRKEIPRPDTSVAEAVSELKQMLQDTSRREGELEKQLADANKKLESVSADLEKSQGERDQARAELDQLKAKRPQTPRRSHRGSGSDEASFEVSSDEEQEMSNLLDSVSPSVTDLQDKIRSLEDELRQSEESRTKSAENMVCKTDLDDAMDRMFKQLSVRDDQAARIAELETNLRASAKKAFDAEQKVAVLEAAAQDGSGNRGRKRSRLQQDGSSSSEGADKSMFESVSSAICKAMDEIRIGQPGQPDLPVADIIISITRALASAESKERLMKFTKGDQTGKSFCFWAVALSDEPSRDECRCTNPQGTPAGHCISFRVLDNATTEVEFSLFDFES